ncbi:hypothetical protein [Methanoculleus frigidifontis]|nr:hypothetical protein [Methanoculleus sp. FWC-SCC1]
MRAYRGIWPAAVLIAVLLAAGCTGSGDLPQKDAVQGTQFDGWAGYPAISADGRFVGFVTAGEYIPTLWRVRSPGDIFLHDRESGETFSIVNTTDLREEYSSFTYPSLSSDGRYIAFEAIAPLPKNPYSMEAGNQSHQVCVVDRVTGEAELISRASDGTGGNSRSIDPVISAGGRFVTFSSWADNLVPGDTNGVVDVFVHDRETGETGRVSTASDGMQGNGESYPSWISGDGRWVVFASCADNLAFGDANGETDVFLHDRETGETSLVSHSPAGVQLIGPSVSPAISSDGSRIVFRSFAEENPPGTSPPVDIFVRDRASGRTTRITDYPPGTHASGWSRAPAVSADGRFVAFSSDASLTAGDANRREDVFVYDMQTGSTTLVSVASDRTPGNGTSGSPDISADGRYVTFVSEASNLVEGDTNGYADVFVHDRETGRTTLVSVANASGSVPMGVQPAGRYVVHWYNADGAEVRFDGEYQGTIDGTSLALEMDPAAPLVTRYSIRSEGSAAYTGCITAVPEPGETIDLFPQNIVTEPPPDAIGDDAGWYVIHPRDEGASVYVDGRYVGDGEVRVPANATAPPYEWFSVVDPDGSGYTVFLSAAPPPSGEVHYYPWVRSVPHRSPAPPAAVSG